MFMVGRMNAVERICSRASVSSGSQNPSILASSDRLAVTPELLPGQLLDQFLQRADAAGQGDERIGAFEHQPLAFVHVRRDDHFLNVRQRIFLAPSGIPG